MRTIVRATSDTAERLFEIMVRATEVACARSYPPEVIAIWHKGRSAEGMRGVISRADFHALVDDGIVRGWVHLAEAEIVGLFVHPDEHGKGYGTELFRFAADRIEARPITVLATLNSVSFYRRMGCRRMGIEAVRRHERDIYVERMELP
jgi:GNAT superfamily N-acetyltransferase